MNYTLYYRTLRQKQEKSFFSKLFGMFVDALCSFDPVYYLFTKNTLCRMKKKKNYSSKNISFEQSYFDKNSPSKVNK